MRTIKHRDAYYFKQNVARELVLALSRYVDTLINAGKLAQTYPLIVQAYDCMIKWILVSQWIIDDRDCYKAVIATLSKGITIFDRENVAPSVPVEPVNVEKKKRRDTAFPPTKQLFQLPPRANKGIHHNNSNTHHHQQDQNTTASNTATRVNSSVRKKEEVAVRMAAEYCMSQFVNQLGRFAVPYEHALGGCRSATVDDVSRLKQIKAKDEHTWAESTSIRYFLIDKRTLLTIIDVTDPNPTKDEPGNVPSIVVVIRDTTGKYVWSMETRYKDKKPVMDLPTKNIASDYLKPPSFNDKRSSTHIKQQKLSQQQQPQGVIVPTAVAVNEREMPSMDKVFLPQSEEWNQWEMVKILMQRQQTSEETNIQKDKDDLTKYQIAQSASNIDLNSPRGFRLLLSQIGFLLPKNRNHITPLHITDSVISEMETLDMLNE